MANSTTHPPQAPMLQKARSVFRPDRDPAIRQEFVKSLRAALQKGGVEFDKLDDLKRRNDAETQAMLTKFRADADERAPAMRDAVTRSAEHWLRAHGVNALPPRPPPKPNLFSLSTADRVSVTPGIDFLFENIAPWANWAEINLDRTTGDVDSFDGNVTFSFSWENQTGQDGLCTLTGLLGVTAHCDAKADAYYWPLTPTPPKSQLDAVAELRITEIVNGQVIEPPFQAGQRQDIIHLSVDGSLGRSETTTQDVFRGYVLQYLDLYVPSNGRLDIDLICGVGWLANDGGCQFHATGNGRQVAGYGVFISQEPSLPSPGPIP